MIIVNDNGRSYAPTIGGLARKLDGIRTNPRYEAVLGWGKRTLHARTARSRAARYRRHQAHQARRSRICSAPQGVFEDLGLKYVGPVDGHDLAPPRATRSSTQRDFAAPVIVHVLTEKGRGYQPAETHDEDRFHAVGKIHPETGLPIEP